MAPRVPLRFAYLNLKEHPRGTCMLQRLVEGVKEEEVQVTIPEGKNMLEVVDLLA